MKKNTRYLFTILLVLTIASLACQININTPRSVTGNGEEKQEVRSVAGFDQLEINGLGDFTVQFGEEESLTIEAEENLLPYIETYVSGSTLVVEIEDGRAIIPTKPVKFNLTVVSLEAVAVSGLGNISLPAIETEHFQIDISGAGNINIESLYADSFKAGMSGLGDLSLMGGEVVTQEVTISGSGKYTAPEMESEEASITISGLGTATLRASQFLKVTISGGGDVNYYGSPEVDSDISGIGGVDRLGD